MVVTVSIELYRDRIDRKGDGASSRPMPIVSPARRGYTLDGQPMVDGTRAWSTGVEGACVTKGLDAERLVADRLRTALPPEYRFIREWISDETMTR